MEIHLTGITGAAGEETSKADHEDKSYVPGCAGDVRTFHTLPTEEICQQEWLMFIYSRI